jgi:DNA-binding beta-propeller fold protein YncE
LYTGQEAYAKMQAMALRWAPDAQPVHIESGLTAESNGQGGKSAVWTGFFASPSRGVVKTIVCSGSRQPDAEPFGVTVKGGEAPYTADFAALSFQSMLLKTDSDKAFAVAQQNGGETLLKQDPKQPVVYSLEGDKKQNPVWYVIYGKTKKEAKGIGVINATTSAFIRAFK